MQKFIDFDLNNEYNTTNTTPWQEFSTFATAICNQLQLQSYNHNKKKELQLIKNEKGIFLWKIPQV